jgi:viologen exporter family transport system permease protein
MVDDANTVALDALDRDDERPRTDTLRRLLALWRLYAHMDAVWMLRDLPSLLTFVLSDLIVSIGATMGTFLLAERFGGIGRWTTDQIIFMLGYALLANGLPDVLFNYNVSYISRRIGRGQLDHTLIQPQPLWMALATEGFSPFSAALELVPGLLVLAWASIALGLHVTPAWLALLALNVAASTAIGVAYAYMWGSLAFWAPRAAEEVNTTTWRLVTQLTSFPLDGVGPALLGGLLTAVPVGLLAWLPSRALLGLDHSLLALFITPAAAIVFIACAVWVFRRGLTQYGRAGSQRYLSLGHRG